MIESIIYKSEFPTGPNATKRQQLLFEADLEFAIESGYHYIKDTNKTIFSIILKGEEYSLHELEVTEEEIDELVNEVREDEVLDVIKDVQEDVEEYCIQSHNLIAIDQIINNTLLQEKKLTSESCNNLLKLAQLRVMLEEVY